MPGLQLHGIMGLRTYWLCSLTVAVSVSSHYLTRRSFLLRARDRFVLWACFVGIPTMVHSGKQLSRDMDLHLAEHEAAPGMTRGCVEAMHTCIHGTEQC